MDMSELALDPSSQEKGPDGESEEQGQLVQAVEDDENGISVASQGTLTLDSSGQYHFRAEAGQGGQVTYRVVQVAQGEDGQQVLQPSAQLVQGEDGIHVLNTGALQPQAEEATGIHVINTASLTANPQVTQVIQSPFSNGGSPDTLATDPRFTYVQNTADPTVGAVATSSEVSTATASLGQVAGGGQFYVMMSPQDVLQVNAEAAGQRVIAPRTGVTPRVETNRGNRDERRRASHNEVERRRRDKMNNWIVQLSKMVPDCGIDNSKQGQVTSSKGGIMAKACEYIAELTSANNQMAETIKETERLSVDNELLKSQIEELKRENAALHATLQQHGIDITK